MKKKIKLLALVMTFVLALSACSIGEKSKDDKDDKDSSSKSSKTSAVDDDDDNDSKDSKSDDEDLEVSLKWPSKSIPKDLKVDGTVTYVLEDKETGQVSIALKGMSEKEANDYIKTLKGLSYAGGMEMVDSDGLFFTGTADDQTSVIFTYNIASKESTITYTPEGASSNPIVTTQEEIDMTDKDKWPDGFLKGVPELKGKITSVSNNNNKYVTVYLDYVTEEDFKAYIETLKINGFTEDSNIVSSTTEIDYSAYNSKGEYVRVLLSISEDYNSAYVDMEIAE